MILIFSVCGASLCVIGYFKQHRTLKKLIEKLDIERIDDDTLDEDERHLLKKSINWSALICLGSMLSFAALILKLFR